MGEQLYANHDDITGKVYEGSIERGAKSVSDR